jgi:hypothetical protein
MAKIIMQTKKRTSNNFFKNMAMFKHLRRTATNLNHIHEEI